METSENSEWNFIPKFKNSVEGDVGKKVEEEEEEEPEEEEETGSVSDEKKSASSATTMIVIRRHIIVYTMNSIQFIQIQDAKLERAR